MIKLFGATDKLYSNNGDLVLQTIKAKVHKEDNGDFYINVEAPLSENEKSLPAVAGTTVTGKNFTLNNVDRFKEVEITNIDGDTYQKTTTQSNQLVNINSSSFSTQEINGVTITNNNDGSITLNGRSTNEVALQISTEVNTPLTAGTYYLNPNKISGTGGMFTTALSGKNQYDSRETIGYSTGTEATITTNQSYTKTYLYIYSLSGRTFSNLVLKPILSKTSGASWEQYTEASPSPDYPQPINVVSGRQDINVVGKNLFDKNNVNFYANNNTAFSNTTDTNKTRVRTSSFNINTYGIKTNTNYIVSGMPSGWTLLGVGTFTSPSATNTSASTASNNVFKITDDNINYIYLLFGNNNSTEVASQSFRDGHIQIELGNTATEYEAYNGNTYEINLGKNLLNYSATGTGQDIDYNFNGSELSLNGTTSGSGQIAITSSQPITLEAGTYTFSNNTSGTFTANGKSTAIYLRKLSDNTGIITLAQNNNYTLTSTFTLTETTKVYVQIYTNGAGFVFDNFNIKWQIEKGNATSYAPYKTPIELCKIGDYKDRIYKDSGKWYTEKKTNKIASYNGEIITTDYISTTGELTTGATIYYVLATPTTTEITDSELINQLNSLKLLEGLNNISITSADLVGTYTIHYNYRKAQSTKTNYIDYLVPNNIIVANTPQGDQAFRITNVENTRSKIKIKAYHVFYDSENYLIQDSYVVDKNCNDALDYLNSNTDNTSPFTTISDITKIASYRCVRKSLYEAIQVLLERYGGHLVRDNWNIGIRASIGQDNGVTIRYGKNLKDIKATYNWDSVCTKLLPVGKDGLLLNALDPTASVYLESATQYEIPYTKSVNFDQNDISEEDYKDEETGEVDEEAYTQALINDLAEKGQNYLQNNSTPVVNYTLNANVEKVSDIGDTIQVIDEKLGISLLTNIISYEYDCILDKYTQIEFGNFTQTLSGLMVNISNQIQQQIDESNATLQITLGQELQEAQDKIWNALGSSYVIYEGDKILVVDSLPKETATNVIMINNGGIGFSNNGINGTFNSAWTIDNILNMEQINVINLTADIIKGGTLKLGSNLNQNGQLEVYDEANSLIAQLNKDGLKMYGVDGSYILMNNTVGFSGYDRLGNQIYWVSKDEFHQKKSVVEEEITLCNKLRFIPITITDGNNNIVNDGIGLVSVAGGGN